VERGSLASQKKVRGGPSVHLKGWGPLKGGIRQKNKNLKTREKSDVGTNSINSRGKCHYRRERGIKEPVECDPCLGE